MKQIQYVIVLFAMLLVQVLAFGQSDSVLVQEIEIVDDESAMEDEIDVTEVEELVSNADNEAMPVASKKMHKI